VVSSFFLSLRGRSTFSVEMASKNLKIGVMMERVQFVDVMGIDILGNLDINYLLTSNIRGAEDFKSIAPTVKVFWISSSLEPTLLTSDVRIVPNATYDDAPRDLDILLIGGRTPEHSTGAVKFMKEAFPKTKHILTTCTGSEWLASSGVLDGKKVTTNRLFLSRARKQYPKTEWLDQRWVVDGNVWSSGGGASGKVAPSHQCLQANNQRHRYDCNICFGEFR
jgi:putative intracellular protease/amidase